jgi:hypothetical protein
MRMIAVDVMRPIGPVVRSANSMERALLMTVFPSRRVHSN